MTRMALGVAIVAAFVLTASIDFRQVQGAAESRHSWTASHGRAVIQPDGCQI